ncbi:MAG: bifunctional pyr operon transcriptional regulator/uracil phosphoribosyltransferase, partial [Nitrospinota bacterium]
MKEIFSSEEIGRAVTRMSHEILEKNRGFRNLALIGLQTRGVFLAYRIAARIEEIEKADIPVGSIDITLYRDDVGSGHSKDLMKETDIAFPLDNKKVVLVDDVLYT